LVADVVARLIAALEPDDVVLGESVELVSCLPVAGPATTPMPFWEDFAFGGRWQTFDARKDCFSITR
jgi:hypothetical protein